METTPRLAERDATEDLPVLHPGADAYLSRLTQEQNRFLGALALANATLGTDGQLAKVAVIQSRLTQEFLDAQRAIIRRRAETEANVARIGTVAEHDAAQVLAAAADAQPCSVEPHPSAGFCSDRDRLPAPTGWPVPFTTGTPLVAASPTASPVSGAETESLAALIDGAFDGDEPDGAVMRRQLREVLDEWWRNENQEAKAAVDDANARAAMRVHVAQVEAGTIARSLAVAPERVNVRHVYEPPERLSPVVDALDSTRHEDLDDLLSCLLEELDDTAAFGPPASPALAPAPAPALLPVLPTLTAAPSTIQLPEAEPDSLTDRSAAPQEAFDRFWSPGARRSRGRDWVFPQLLLPAVSVIAVLALVLAIVG